MAGSVMLPTCASYIEPRNSYSAYRCAMLSRPAETTLFSECIGGRESMPPSDKPSQPYALINNYEVGRLSRAVLRIEKFQFILRHAQYVLPQRRPVEEDSAGQPAHGFA